MQHSKGASGDRPLTECPVRPIAQHITCVLRVRMRRRRLHTASAHKRRSHRSEADTETIVHTHVRGTSRGRSVAEATSPESIATAQPVVPRKCRQPAVQKWSKKVVIAEAHPVCSNEHPTTSSNSCLHGTGDQASFTNSIATKRASERLLGQTQKLAPVLGSVGLGRAKSVPSDSHVGCAEDCFWPIVLKNSSRILCASAITKDSQLSCGGDRT